MTLFAEAPCLEILAALVIGSLCIGLFSAAIIGLAKWIQGEK